MATTVLKEGQPGSKASLKDSYLLHKLHSLSGVIPIGAFMMFHLVANSYSLRGRAEFDTAVKAIGYTPFVLAVEIAAILLPITFHAVYGIIIIRSMQSIGGNVVHYGYQRNWLYLLQRLSGIVALAYICFHVYDTTVKKWWMEYVQNQHAQGLASITYDAMAWRLADYGYLAIYLIGVAAAAFHLGNGVLSFCIRWGITIGKEAQKIAALAGIALGLGLTLLGWAIAGNFHLKGKEIRNKYPTFAALVEARTAEMGKH
jgi:succinate dehydrogenase/fumarate reductase cytochrome b subunit (b558 family)